MKINNETKIGIMVTICLIALGALTCKVGDFSLNKKGYEIKAEFINIDGVETNAPVRLNGLEIGKVTDIEIIYGDQTKMLLTIWIDETAKVKDQVKASVKTMGLMGEKYIALTDSGEGDVYLEKDSLVIGQEPLDIDALMAKGDVIADNVNLALENIVEITDNVKERLALNKESIDQIIENLKYVSENFEELSGDLKRNPWKLLFRTKEKKEE